MCEQFAKNCIRAEPDQDTMGHTILIVRLLFLVLFSVFVQSANFLEILHISPYLLKMLCAVLELHLVKPDP